MRNYQLAQINIGRIRGADMNDPVMKEFVDNLTTVNTIAEASKGFIWRLKDDSDNATSFNPFNDEQIIINMSVWDSIENLEEFMYRTMHADFLRRRREWFHRYGKVYTAMWWIEENKFPTIQEAVDNLAHLEQHGPTEKVFDFKKKFSRPQ
jgi:Domain of unknown function (DUF3291)